MSRRILSRASGVSERYLAQLETGKGNISIALLRKVAEAMSVPLADLVREGSERPVDLTLLIRKLERLQPDELAEANRHSDGNPRPSAKRPTGWTGLR